MKRKIISSIYLAIMLPVAALGCDVHKESVKVMSTMSNIRLNAGVAAILDRNPVMVMIPEDKAAEIPADKDMIEQEPGMELKDDDYILKKLAMAEAEGEDVKGKALVMQVVLNRVRSIQFPDTVKEVVYQEGEFSPVINGRFEQAEPDQGCKEALEMVKEEQLGTLSMEAVYFESKGQSTWHSRNLQYLFRHGNHYFYKEKE